MKNFLPKDNRGFDLKRRDGFTIDPKTSLKSGQSQPSRLRTPEQVDGWAHYGVTRDADRSGSADDVHDKQFTGGMSRRMMTITMAPPFTAHPHP